MKSPSEDCIIFNYRFNVNGSREDTTLSVNVRCKIIERKLEVVDLQEKEQIKRLCFDHVYYGSVITKKLILSNNSPIASDFIIVIDEKMSECINKSKSLALTFTKCDSTERDEENAPSLDSIFEISPNKVGVAVTSLQLVYCSIIIGYTV